MIEQIKDINEQILWSGKPNKLVYIIGSPFFYLFALFWGGFDFLFISKIFSFNSSYDSSIGSVSPFLLLFFAIHLAPVWFAILGPVFRFFAWNNIEYAVTDKRVYLVSGIFGRDITSIEHREAQKLSVDVSPIENMFKIGSIYLTSYISGNNRSSTSRYTIKHIGNPYEVYNLIKRVSLDVYTDQQFPNMYRPDENKGYKTKYTGK